MMRIIDKQLENYIRNNLRYEPISGRLYWTKPAQGRSLSKPAGTVASNGYLQIYVNDKSFLQHQIVWFLLHGKWPQYQIDHIDGNKKNNRQENLRDITASANQRHRNNFYPGWYLAGRKQKNAEG